MKLLEYTDGKHIIEQGGHASYFFIIKTGQCEVLINNEHRCMLGYGDSFGEIALLHDERRSASVSAVETVQVWVIDRESFKDAVEKISYQGF
jgi:CRP-like cAMP-binding protein